MYAFYIRRYSTIFKNEEKKYLHVPDDGTLDLVDVIVYGLNLSSV